MAASKSTPELKLVRTSLKADLISDEKLTQQQKQVINHRGSQLLVLGSAGSGKSSTLVKAIANRISSGEDPNSILAITYGRSSANKLRDQIASANCLSFLPFLSGGVARRLVSLSFAILFTSAIILPTPSHCFANS